MAINPDDQKKYQEGSQGTAGRYNNNPGQPQQVRPDATPERVQPQSAAQTPEDYFQQQVGRPLNQQEKDWLYAGRGDVRKVSAMDAVSGYVSGLNTLSQRILSDAQNIYGITGFTIDDANKLRDNLYIAGDQRSHDTFDQRYQAALTQRKTEDLINPKVAPEQQTKFNETVSGMFQEYLGRPPKPYEMEHFAKQLAQGDDPFLLASTLQQAPEYQEKKANTERQRLAGELQGYQEQAFQKAAPTMISSFMKAGRLNSSGVTSALSKAQQELEQQRQQYLAGISREDFVNNNAKAWDIFGQQNAPSVQRAQDLTTMRYRLPFEQGAALTSRGNELSDWYREQNDFNRYLQSQKDQSRRSAQYGLTGQILGAGLQGAAMYYGNKGD